MYLERPSLKGFDLQPIHRSAFLTRGPVIKKNSSFHLSGTGCECDVRGAATKEQIVISQLIPNAEAVLHSHYNTLHLPRNCTAKDIRESFIKLSKEWHPDKNSGDPKTHARFVKLNEAYSILSRPDKRKEYDLTLPRLEKVGGIYTTAPRGRVVFRDGSFWENRDRSKDNFDQNKGYYGFRGINRVSNARIALLCFIFAGCGVYLQFLAIRFSMTLSRDRLDEYSYQNGLILSKARKEALLNGNKLQLEMMRERLGLSEEEQAVIISVPIIPPLADKEEEKERGEVEALIWVIEKDERVAKTKPEVLETNGSTKTDAHSDVEEESLDLDIKLVSEVEIKSRVETTEDERMMGPIINSFESEDGARRTKGIFLEKLAKSPLNPSPAKISEEAAVNVA
uniref:J domain-containing protein n=1 Tax=Timema tahoe TaxID=61484 RepID=A0A7R9IS61_9NEOP|nr:unnamed protein product [Timema tahoe]